MRSLNTETCARLAHSKYNFQQWVPVACRALASSLLRPCLDMAQCCSTAWTRNLAYHDSTVAPPLSDLHLNLIDRHAIP